MSEDITPEAEPTIEPVVEETPVVVEEADLEEAPVVEDKPTPKPLPTRVTVPVAVDNKEDTYLRSSKVSPEYKNKHFKIEDILDCYEPYNKLLSKALDLTKP
jgi:hypothetical protein